MRKANLILSGSVSWHIVRKYVFSTLLRSGFNAYEAKHYLGKALESSDSTYIQSLHETMLEKFKVAYPNLSLQINGNGTRIKVEELEEKVKEQQATITTLSTQLTVLNQVLIKALPKKAIRDAIREIKKEHDIKEATFEGRNFFKTENLSIEDLAKQIQSTKPKEETKKE